MKGAQTTVDRQAKFVDTFTVIEFNAYVQNCQFSKMGDLQLLVQVPAEEKDTAICLTDAFTVPLRFTVKIREDYLQSLEES